MRKNDLNTLRVDEYFFENGGKNLRFQKYPENTPYPVHLWSSCEEIRGRRERALGAQQFPHQGRVTKHFVL